MNRILLVLLAMVSISNQAFAEGGEPNPIPLPIRDLVPCGPSAIAWFKANYKAPAAGYTISQVKDLTKYYDQINKPSYIKLKFTLTNTTKSKICKNGFVAISGRVSDSIIRGEPSTPNLCETDGRYSFAEQYTIDDETFIDDNEDFVNPKNPETCSDVL